MVGNPEAGEKTRFEEISPVKVAFREGTPTDIPSVDRQKDFSDCFKYAKTTKQKQKQDMSTFGLS